MRSAQSHHDIFEDVSNPLDSVEEILCANEWIFDRMTEDELTVQVTGKMGEYKLFFHWQEDYSAMQFSCEMDVEISESAMDAAAKTMTEINSSLWLGHFDFRSGTNIPHFRHTTLFRGMTHTSGAEHLEDLVDIAISECERYFPVFDIFSRGLPANDADMSLAIMNVAGMS
ncbi:MAG: YbjN domain-containing protein [Micavibrio sp.]